MNTDLLTSLYRSVTGNAPELIEALTGAGSNRSYFRLHGKPTLIGVYGTSVEENQAFTYMAAHFQQKGIPVPKVYAVSADGLAYLQEDLGNTSLFQQIENGRKTGCFRPEEVELLRQTIRLLPRIQFAGAEGMDFSVCYPQSNFDRRAILWDLNYFKYCFLKTTGVEFREDRLENDFECMASRLLQVPADSFMYRDFQSRNVMIKEGKPFFIDFQGGRKGPCYYDVASFLWQAKANLPDNVRKELIDAYLEALCPYLKIEKDEFMHTLRHFVLFRTLQVLGAYGFRGFFEKKPHFIESVPFALANLSELLKDDFKSYPYLCEVLHRVIQKMSRPALPAEEKKLTVTVMSFSYRKGIPEDESGNGGGYVFDCRAIHNPGRYEPYKQLTGRDEPVIRFLEDNGEIFHFLEHTDALVDAHAERYLKRGFTHLSVYFGCTGGQHRSVYSAQHTAEHLHRKYGVKVHLIHREQAVEQIFEAL